MKSVLADGNLLIALTVSDHVHHQAATTWFKDHLVSEKNGFLATTPITQGTLLRFLLREGFSATNAMNVLTALTKNSWHTFWNDSLPYSETILKGVIGHRQVTDAYLVALAAHNNGLVATLDRGLALLHESDTLLIRDEY